MQYGMSMVTQIISVCLPEERGDQREIHHPLPPSSGPGQYSVPQLPGGPAFTMRTRLASSDDASEAADLPGPGDYEQRPSLPGGPAYTFRARPVDRSDSRPSSQGPGERPPPPALPRPRSQSASHKT